MKLVSFLVRNLALLSVFLVPAFVLAQSTVTTEQEPSDCQVKVIPDPCVSDCRLQLDACQVQDLTSIKLNVFNAFGNQVAQTIPYNKETPRVFHHLDPNDPTAPAVYIIRTPRTKVTKEDDPYDDSNSVSDL